MILQVLVMSLAIATGLAGEAGDVSEWHREVLVKAAYGTGAGEFGYKGIENAGGQSSPVSCYWVGAEGIFLVDVIQSNVKVFGLDGEWLRTIPGQDGPTRKRLGRVFDICVTEGRMYLLYERLAIPPPGRSKYIVYVFELGRDEFMARYEFFNPAIDVNRSGSQVGHASRLHVSTAGDVSIYSLIRDTCYPLTRRGVPVEPDLHAVGEDGRRLENGIVLIRTAAGLRLVPDGSTVLPRRVYGWSSDGSRYLMHPVWDRTVDGKQTGWILDDRGWPVAYFRIDIDERRAHGWAIPGVTERYRFGPGNALYEAFEADDGFTVVRWSE